MRIIVLPQLLGDIAEERATQRPVSGGVGGIGPSKGCCSQMGHFLATPTSARNAPSATPGDRARARHCVSGLFCVCDDPAEIAGCQLRRFV